MAAEKKYSYWLHTGMYGFLQRMSVMFFGIASFFVLARALSTDHMGVWAHFLSITAAIELIRFAIVKNAFIKYLSVHYKESNNEITTAALVLNIMVTVSIGLLILFFQPALSSFLKAPALTREMYIFLFGLILLIPFSHFEWIQNSQGDFKGIFFAYMARQGSWFLMMLAHLAIKGTVSLPYLAFYYSLGILIGSIVAFRFVRKYLNKKNVFVKGWLAKLWNYGKVILGSSLSTLFFKNIDQMMVSHIISLTAVALYNMSLRIINLLDMPSQIIGDIMFPKSAQVDAVNNTKRLKEMYEKSVGGVLSLVIPACIFIFLFPEFLLNILAGKKYIEAAYIVRLMLINSIFTAFIKQFATIMDSSGKAKLNFSIITLMAVLSIVFCYFFTKMFGIPGTVLSITLTHVIGFCLSQYYLRKHYRVNFLNAFKYAINFYPELFNIARLKIKQRGISFYSNKSAS